MFLSKWSRCPRCNDDASIIIFTSCGHKMCVQCKNKAFRRRTGEMLKCLECKASLSKKDILEKSWGQMQIENEIRIRNNLREEFDAKPEDFDSAKQYYDYMEELEEMVELKLENKIAEFNERLKKCKREKHFRRKKNYEFEQRRIRFKHFGQKVSIEEIKYPNLKEDFVKQGSKIGGKKNLFRAGRLKETYLNRQNNLLQLANLNLAQY